MIRDSSTNALISNDIVERDKYRLEKAKNKQMTDLQQEVRLLKEEIRLIKNILHKNLVKE